MLEMTNCTFLENEKKKKTAEGKKPAKLFAPLTRVDRSPRQNESRSREVSGTVSKTFNGSLFVFLSRQLYCEGRGRCELRLLMSGVVEIICHRLLLSVRGLP